MCVQLFLAQHIITCEICQASVHQEANLQTYTTTEKTETRMGAGGGRTSKTTRRGKSHCWNIFTLLAIITISIEYFLESMLTVYVYRRKKKAVCFEGL